MACRAGSEAALSINNIREAYSEREKLNFFFLLVRQMKYTLDYEGAAGNEKKKERM